VKQLLESRNRREGPIVKFTEDGFWQTVKLESKYNYKTSLPYYKSSIIVPFSRGKTIENPVLYDEFLIAQLLMKQYKDQSRSIDDVFDTEKFAKYFALIDLVRAYHSRAWHNQRMYYNPIICKLEPIAYDGFGEDPKLYNGIENNYIYRILKNKDIHENEFDLVSNLFNDSSFINKYINYLQKYSSDNFVNSQLQINYKELAYYDSLLKLEFPSAGFDTNYLYKSAIDIRSYLPELDMFLSNYASSDKISPDSRLVKYSDKKIYENTPEFFVNTYSSDIKNDSLQIEVFNYYPRKITLLGTGINKKHINFYFSKGIYLTQFRNHVESSLFTTDTLANYLFYIVEGNETIFKSEILKWPFPRGETPRQELVKYFPLSNNPLVESIKDWKVYIKTGKITCRQPLIIPKGYRVYIQAGTTIDFLDSSFILSNSPLFMLGTTQDPINITSSDFSANGIAVLQSDTISKLENVRFENLNTLNYKGWVLTGAVTFYESDVNLENVTFYRNQCEDALNIVRSEFKLANSVFENIFGDAFDSDFSNGIVKGTSFSNIGNDAIDFSGSKISIENTTIKNVNDKGISGGEDSHLKVFNVVIEKSNIGIASKDLSTVDVSATKLSDCFYGLVLLQKKPEYGGAKIVFNNSQIIDPKTEMLIEKGSTVLLDGKLIVGKAENVSKILY
jgi:hypothetical protein